MMTFCVNNFRQWQANSGQLLQSAYNKRPKAFPQIPKLPFIQSLSWHADHWTYNVNIIEAPPQE